VLHVDVGDLTPQQLRALVDQIYSDFPNVEFTPEVSAERPQTATRERTQTDVRYPVRYKVIFLNDDFTPMDFVIQLLVEIFNKNIDDAHAITMEIHNSGSGVAGVYSLEIAEQKTHEALILCKHAGHPLEIVYEPA
jgi:ATP-dependent Clp protease adaptor protein ClpS